MVLEIDMELLIDIIDVCSCVILHTHIHTHLIYITHFIKEDFTSLLGQSGMKFLEFMVAWMSNNN